MEKSDLKTGMTVRLANGDYYRVIRDVETVNYGHQEFVLVALEHMGFLCFDTFNENLECDDDNYYDIIEIFENRSTGEILCDSIGKSIWTENDKNEKIKELTISEIEEKLGYKIKIINK